MVQYELGIIDDKDIVRKERGITRRLGQAFLSTLQYLREITEHLITYALGIYDTGNVNGLDPAVRIPSHPLKVFSVFGIDKSYDLDIVIALEERELRNDIHYHRMDMSLFSDQCKMGILKIYGERHILDLGISPANITHLIFKRIILILKRILLILYLERCVLIGSTYNDIKEVTVSAASFK